MKRTCMLYEKQADGYYAPSGKQITCTCIGDVNHNGCKLWQDANGDIFWMFRTRMMESYFIPANPYMKVVRA